MANQIYLNLTLPRCSLSYLKIIQTESNGKSNLFEFDIAEVQFILLKDNTNRE